MITGNKYPTEYFVQGTSWATAIARAIREWQKGQGKGSRTEKISVRAVKGGQVLNENQM